MYIANPIYDAVFKYLMEDKEVAMILISELLGETLADLQFLPQEVSKEVDKGHHWVTIYRMDFACTIQLSDQTSQQVIIEIQKAKFHTDIMRFRNYLGMQYSKKDNVVETEVNGFQVKQALPIYSIYFLGHRLDHIRVPVVDVKREYRDRYSGERIIEREEFIESLTHDSIVIQIPLLQEEVRSDLERLLSVFNQDYVVSADKHTLNIDESLYPEKYRKVLRRLKKAISEEEVRENMDVEDDFLEEWQDQERRIFQAEERAEKAEKQVGEEKQRAEEEKQRAEEEKQRAEEEKQRAEEEKQRAEEALQREQALRDLLQRHGIDPS